MTLSAGCLVTLTLGSVHAFSVFLLPLETAFGVGRSRVSFVYSLALLSLTIMVLVGHRFYATFRASTLSAVACAAAGGGLLLAGVFDTLSGLYAGYGLVFGAANGLGYGFVLQLVAQAMPRAAGFAMGAVTAVYAIGALLFAKVFAGLLATLSPSRVMMLMSMVLIATAVLVWGLLTLSRDEYTGTDLDRRASHAELDRALIVRLWLGYGAAAAAGLMLIGHASAIVMERGGDRRLMVAGAMLIAAGNAFGGIVAGAVADRLSTRLVLTALALVSVLCLIAMLLAHQANFALFMLASIGFSYGATIAVYPAAVLALFGAARSARVYGIIFTAWGGAGLGLPWLAGFLFDRSGSYDPAIEMAAGLSVVAALLAYCLPKAPTGRP